MHVMRVLQTIGQGLLNVVQELYEQSTHNSLNVLVILLESCVGRTPNTI